MATPRLVNQFGTPVRASDFYQAGSLSTVREQPWRFYSSAKDTADLLPNASWRQILSSSRFLFANVPIVRGALLEQALYSFPLEPRYTGPDKEWGDLAETRLYEWAQNPTLRGWPFDQHTVSRLRLLGYKSDGDIFTVLTAGRDAEPRIQLVRAHRVGNRDTNVFQNRLMTGPYKDRRIYNGTIVDDFGAAIAYLILGGNADEDQYVSARGMFPTCRPDFYDQYRGISHLCASIRSFADHKRLREYELRAMAIQSSVAMIEKNETGFADEASEALSRTSRDGITDGTRSSLVSETLEEGMIKYFRAGTGSGLEMLRPDRPGENWQAFEERVVGAALYGLEWDPNFALLIKEPGGANARITLQKVNRCILQNAGVEARAQRREAWYKLEWDIAHGLLRPPSDGNTRNFTWKLALPQLTADSGNEENAKREAYKLGLDTLLTLTTERGQDWEEVRQQRRREIENLLEHVRQIQAANPEIPFAEILNLFEQRNPNGAAAAATAGQMNQPPVDLSP